MSDDLAPQWQRRRVGDIAEVVSGQSPPGSTVKEWDGVPRPTGLPFIQGNAEFGDRSPSPTKWCTAPAKRAEAGDTLLSVRAPVGETNRADTTLAIGRGVAAIRFKGVTPEYGWHALNHAKRGFGMLSQGSTFTAITGDVIRRLEVVAPPPAEQRAITAALDTIDDTIELSEGAIAATETLRLSLLHELFTRGMPGRHTEWKHVPGLGTIPACWLVKDLASLATVTSGATPKAGEPRYYEGGTIPFVRINDVTRVEGLIHSTELHITPAAMTETAVRLYPVDTVLVTMYGTIGSVGRIARPMAANQAIAAFLQPRCRPAFLEHLVRWHGPSFARLAGRTTQANISGESLKRYKVAVPADPGEVDKIVDLLESASALQFGQRATATALHAMKGTIADALLSGQLRLRGAVGVAAEP